MRHYVLLIAGCVCFAPTRTIHAQQPADPAGRVRAAPQPRSATVYRLLDGKRASFDVVGTGPGNVHVSRGSMEIQYKNGHATMRLQVDSLVNPLRVGTAYTAYVWWAVTGDGKVVRLA